MSDAEQGSNPAPEQPEPPKRIRPKRHPRITGNTAQLIEPDGSDPLLDGDASTR